MTPLEYILGAICFCLLTGFITVLLASLNLHRKCQEYESLMGMVIFNKLNPPTESLIEEMKRDCMERMLQ